MSTATSALLVPEHAVGVDRDRWRAWLHDQLDPTWRPGEWDGEHWFFDGDPDYERTVVTRCAVQRCGAKLDGEPICTLCSKAWRASGKELDVFAAEHIPVRVKRRPGTDDESCAVTRDGVQCARPSHCSGLCRNHYTLWMHFRSADRSRTMADWLARGNNPYPRDLRQCLVPRCEARTVVAAGLCRYHHQLHRRTGKGTPVGEWAATAPPFLTAGQFSLLPLAPLVRAELLFALQRRDAAGSSIAPKFIRRIVRAVEHRTHLAGLHHQDLSPTDGVRNTDLDTYRRDVAHWLRVGYEQMTGVEPTHRLVWDFRTLDLRGSESTRRRRTAGGQADFTVISQAWLREVTMARCRDFTTSQKICELLVAVEVASRALEATVDGGHELAALGPAHLDAITQGFRSWNHPDGRPRSNTRRYVGLEAVFALIDYGRRAGMLDGLTHAFVRDPAAHRLQLDHPAPEEVGKAIPEPVIAQLDAQLPLLECIADYRVWSIQQQRHMIRTLYIVLRDTGRRPREVCSLREDCVEFDKDGPLLIWDNHKAGRHRRRLPITTQTADAIAEWREVRHTLSTGDRRDDYLFPAASADRIDPYFRPASLTRSLRVWVDSLPELLSDAVDTRGQRMPFDRALIHPYAFRHSYAQRHADAGVAIDVLRDLMDHRQISTTQTYYRVTLKRKREAVQTLRLHVADRHGSSAPTSSNTAYEMRSVAAPFGNCVEPSNVKAGGGACPIRFQCSGCGFYRPDPSYLPAIEDHILALRSDREIASAMDVDTFVLRNLDEQIASYQHVVDGMKARLAALPDDQQHEVEQAGALLRRIRAGAAASPVQLPVTTRPPGTDRP